MISIDHSHAEGTVVHGTGRGDGTNIVFKALNDGWRFSRNIDGGAWYLPRSRDRNADRPRITRLADALREAGYPVEIHLDDDRRTPAQIEADRASTVAGRVERYTDLAEQRTAEGIARLDHVRERRSHIPLGQPIMDTRDAHRRERLNRAEDIGREHLATGEHWRRRADAATSTQRHRHNPRLITRRIERLDAELRRWQRSLAHVRSASNTAQQAAYTQRAEQEIAVLRDEADYWRGELAVLQARGIWQAWTPEHFHRGDEALIGGTWYPVVRVNRKSLTVPPKIFGGQRHLDANGKDPWTDTAPYDTIFGRRREGKTLHYPPPDPEATCTEPLTTTAPGSERDSAIERCTEPPVVRVIVGYDGHTCGCAEPCLNPSDADASGVPWMQTRLLCTAHAEDYRRDHPAATAATATTCEDLT